MASPSLQDCVLEHLLTLPRLYQLVHLVSIRNLTLLVENVPLDLLQAVAERERKRGERKVSACLRVT